MLFLLVVKQWALFKNASSNSKLYFPISFLNQFLYLGLSDYSGHNSLGYYKDKSTLSFIVLIGEPTQDTNLYSLGF